MKIFSAWRMICLSCTSIWKKLTQQTPDRQIIVALTQYHVKKPFQHEFMEVLSRYIFNSLDANGNIMAEAYYEKGDFCIIWIIERWNNYSFYKNNKRSREAKAVDTLTKTGLVSPVEITFMKDFLQLTNDAGDIFKAREQPVTLMLFVDVKTGTENHFRLINRMVMSVFQDEPGIIVFRLSQIICHKTKFIIFKKFRDWNAFQYHLKDPALKPLMTFLHTSIKEPPYEKGYHHLIQFAPLNNNL